MPRANKLVAMLFAVALFLSALATGSQSQAYARQDAANDSAVPIANADGATVGSITVTDVVDPFTDFDPNYAPEEGSRYVAVTVAFDADAGQRFDIQPSSIVLQDDQGFIVNQAYISLPSDALIPIVSSQTLSPGSRITGLVVFSLPAGRKPARVFLQPQGNQLVLLADLSNAPNPAIGEAVAIHDAEGDSGTVTVSDVTDSFEDLAQDQVPPDGSGSSPPPSFLQTPAMASLPLSPIASRCKTLLGSSGARPMPIGQTKRLSFRILRAPSSLPATAYRVRSSSLFPLVSIWRACTQVRRMVSTSRSPTCRARLRALQRKRLRSLRPRR